MNDDDDDFFSGHFFVDALNYITLHIIHTMYNHLLSRNYLSIHFFYYIISRIIHCIVNDYHHWWWSPSSSSLYRIIKINLIQFIDPLEHTKNKRKKMIERWMNDNQTKCWWRWLFPMVKSRFVNVYISNSEEKHLLRCVLNFFFVISLVCCC